MAAILATETTGRADWRAEVAASFAAERDRLVLWLPVAQGLGIGWYFLLEREPALMPGVWAAVLCLIAAVLGRARPVVLASALVGCAMAAGFASAAWRTQAVAAPILGWRTGAMEVTGRVVEVAGTPERGRLTLDQVTIAGLDPADTPARIRVSARRPGDAVNPGDRVALRALLQPPDGPPLPGGHDFGRDLYFRGIGASGIVTQPVRRIAAAEEGGGFEIWLAQFRRAVTARIEAPLDRIAGPVAAAMITGERGSIPGWVDEVMRDSGIYHLLSISGVHFSIVAAVIFLCVRRALALIEPVALRYPIKKWAAAIAIAASFFYLLLSGNSVPAQRSFAMIAVVLLAVLIDRSALSMRTVAFAAVAVLALGPEALLGPSFQMSFAAVAALIAVYEVVGPRFATAMAEAGPVRKAMIWLASTCLVTLVAGCASAPFAVYHFGRFVNYGVVANLIAVPLTTIWVMPLSVLAMVLMPFGLEALALVPLGWGVHLMLWIAKWVAGWPGAVIALPTLPLWGLMVMVAGGLWLILWRTRLRLAGFAAVAVGLASFMLNDPPDVIVDDSGKLVAVRAADGGLMVRAPSQRKRDAAYWLRFDGQAKAEAWPGAENSSADGRLTCDSDGCLYHANGKTVSIVTAAEAIRSACRQADLVIAEEPARGRCRGGQARLIDRFDLWRRGPHAVWLRPDGIEIRTVAEERGERPWSPPRRPRPKLQPAP